MAITRSTLEFERLSENHIAQLMPIELDAYPEPWTARMFRDETRNARSHFVVARLEGVLTGYGGFWLVLDEAHITSVTIKLDARGQGYGRELFEYLLDIAREAGSRIATLEVRDSNMPAQNLYRSIGFKQVGIRKGYYPKSGEDAIVMSARL